MCLESVVASESRGAVEVGDVVCASGLMRVGCGVVIDRVVCFGAWAAVWEGLLFGDCTQREGRDQVG